MFLRFTVQSSEWTDVLDDGFIPQSLLFSTNQDLNFSKDWSLIFPGKTQPPANEDSGVIYDT